jgi:hypothetical protein
MIHYLYATRGGYLYLVGRYSERPKAEKMGEFILSVPEKTPQAAIDTLAHRRFMDHLRKPRKPIAAQQQKRHHKEEKQLVTV